MSEILQAGQHPDADQLNAFVEHSLPAHEQQQTLAHLSICADCRQIVALSLPPAGESPVVQPSDRRRWFPRLRPAWAGIPAFAALILVMLFARKNERNVGQTSEPAQVADARKPAAPVVESEPPVVALPDAAPLALRPPQRRRGLPANQQAPSDEAGQAQVRGSAGAMMGGVSGGIASSPTQPSMPGRLFGASAGIAGRPVNGRVVGGLLSVVSPLPSRLGVLSMAAHGNQRIAIDTENHLFLSEDEGRNWKAVASPWKGRAVLVALTSRVSSGSAAPALKMSSRPAVATGAGLYGTVTDPSSGVIPGATVVATNSAAGIVRNAVTDQRGQFRIANLVPGLYRIETQAIGFQSESFPAEVAPAQQTVADVKLQVGSASQTVSVDAQGSSIPLESLPVDANLAGRGLVSQTVSRFELTTDSGEHWMSTDGERWTRE